MTNFTSLGISIFAHALILGAMFFVKWTLIDPNANVMIETFFNEETPVEQINQKLTLKTEVSESLSLNAGGVISTEIGSTGQTVAAQTKIEQSETLKDPDIPVNVGTVSIPGANMLTDDLGETDIKGDSGARVEGYGEAMSRLTHEIIRMMRKQPVHVVWMFDESKSIEDDRKEISEQFQKVYEELRIADKRDIVKTKGNKPPLITTVLGYGSEIHDITKRPTDDVDKIKKSIQDVQVDTTGKENLMDSLIKAVKTYGELSQRQGRKCAIIVVTDESGDDGGKVEEALQLAKRRKVPVYFMARESVFGFPYSREAWVDPETKITFHVQVRRGPETPLPECLQYDGFHARWDNFSAGFGPYEMTRIARETGGIFFMLVSKSDRSRGAGSNLPRFFDDLAMKEYHPDLNSRREYEQERGKSQFRKTIWDVIVTINPYLHNEINIKEHHYSIEESEFRNQGADNFRKALNVLSLLNTAIQRMEKIKPLRDSEPSTRWRANYDLAYAQLLIFRVRCFQTLLALDNHARTMPPLKKPNSNYWNLRRVGKVQPPTEEQIKLTKIDMDEIKKQESLARKLLVKISDDHPGTPWALRANYELRLGFGVTFAETFVDPKYFDPAVRARIPKF